MLQLEISADLMVFEGHFDGCPVVPGIAQVDWALRWTASLLGMRAASQELRHLKFMRALRPGTLVVLELSLNREQVPPRLSFRYSDALGDYSQGTAIYCVA